MNDEIYSLVKEILEKRPDCRDSDMKLAFLFYKIKQSDFYPTDKPPMTVIRFFSLLDDKTLPKLSSITRSRRLIQRNYPDLRGSSWDARQVKATKKVVEFVKDKTYTDAKDQENEYHTQKLN